MTKDEVVGWHHQLNRHESEQTRGDGGGRGVWSAAVTPGAAVRHTLVTEQQHKYFGSYSKEKDHIPGKQMDSLN